MDKVRCKFIVVKVAETNWKVGSDANCQIVTLNATYGSTGEDASFASATPSGQMEFTISNPAVIGFFKPGEEFYVDLVPVSKERPAVS